MNSQALHDQGKWLGPLKLLFSRLGSTPKNWEIFRGDSFQLEIYEIENSFAVAVSIKAVVKAIRGIDVRLAIGIGEKYFDAPKITESNGPAFVFSGEKFESLKKEKINLAVKSPWETFDKEMNLYIKLALIAMDNWTPKSAELVQIMLQNPEINQQEIAARLKISQSSVSQRQQRVYWSEIMEIDKRYREKLQKLIK